MKRCTFLLLGFLICSLANAQYGNEWINYNQTYFKFKTNKEGLYRLSYSTLTDAGVPLASIDPRNIQIFHNGKEQFILIEGESDGTFDPTDFIEFYGYYNDGELDAPLWRNLDERAHSYTSFYQDSTVYFLTWTTSTPGKRFQQNSNTDFTGLAPDARFQYTSSLYWWVSGSWFDGIRYAELGSYAEYTRGEGFVSGAVVSSPRNYSMVTPYYDSAGPAPVVRVEAISTNDPTDYGADGNNHEFQMAIVVKGKENIIYSKRHRGYNVVRSGDITIPKTYVLSPTAFRFRSLANSIDRHYVSVVEMDYPRKFDLGSSTPFRFTAQTSNTMVEFANYPTTKTAPRIYNLTTGESSTGVKNVKALRFRCNPNPGDQIFIADAADAIQIVTVLPVTFRDYSSEPTDISYLMISNSTLDSGAQEYRKYRESSDGGSYVVGLAYADELYDEFYYGIHHPLALRNWIHYMSDRQATKPEFLLLLGKARNYVDVVSNYTVRTYSDLVPTLGYPPSDYLFTSPLDQSDLRPSMATGRVPATTNQEITDYLTKVKAHDLYPITSKRIMQIAGGIDEAENVKMVGYLSDYGKIIASDSFGGTTRLFSKESALTVDESLIEKITSTVDEGVNMVNYFGHGASTITEVDMGKAEEYHNLNRYPVYFFNGCILGNTFTQDPTLCEEFLFTPDRGAIAWIAGSYYGYTAALNSICRNFHLNAFRKSYGKTLGEIMQNAIADNMNLSDDYNITHSRVMLLHGDPAVRFYSPDKPDFYSDASTISINTSTGDLNSFNIEYKVFNQGKVTYDSFTAITFLLNGSDTLSRDTSVVPGFTTEDNVVISVDRHKLIGGINRVVILIDPFNTIAEYGIDGEQNNITFKDIFIRKNKLEIIAPELDEIVSTSEVKIWFTEYYKPENPIPYKLIIDTTSAFNGVPTEYTFNASEVLNSYKLQIPPFNKTDFYVAIVNTQTGDTAVTTFAYLFGSTPGLSQGYFEKFNNNLHDRIYLNPKSGKMEFTRRVTPPIWLYTSGTNLSYWFSTQATYTSILYMGVWGTMPGLNVFAINRNDGSFYLKKNTFNQVSPAPWDPAFNTDRYLGKDSLSCLYRFNTTIAADRDSLRDFLNGIPGDFEIFVMNEGKTGIVDWSEDLFVAFENLGASKIRSLKEDYPYIFHGKQSLNPGEGIEVTADLTDLSTPPESQIITYTSAVYPLETSGTYKSRVFGPAKSWGSAEFHGMSDNSSDEFELNVFGIDTSGIENLVAYGDFNESVVDLSEVDAAKYPKVYLVVNVYDERKRTPIEIERWTVRFTGFPDGFAYSETPANDTFDIGGNYTVNSVFYNISALPLDSVVVDRSQTFYGSAPVTSRDTLRKISAGDSVHFKHQYPNVEIEGNHQIITIFNPGGIQPEKDLSNNGVLNEIYVAPNHFKPQLEVYFDNQQIINGQIINPNARINILGKSNHPNLKIDEENYYSVYLIKKSTSKTDTISATNTAIDFVAENGSDPSTFQFSFNNLSAGKYTIQVILYSPGTDNQNLKTKYAIDFEVSDKNEITELLPYPNPMVNQCRFAYNFSGRVLPTRYLLNIYTITGKLVRSIDQDEFGALSYGPQLSQFVFDGTDDFGDRLANGVYLYRFDIKDVDKSQDDRLATYFTDGYGKLYISR